MSTLDNEIFFDASGLGALPGTAFNGSIPQVVSYNTIGAAAGTNGTASYAVTAAFALNGGGSGGVTQIVAGTNITISPPGGTGIVTINASSTTTSASYAQSASVAVSASYARSASVSVSSSYALSSSFASTASYVQTAQTASYVLLAQTASYVALAQSASYVQTAQTASYVLQAVSASFASTAISSSYAQSASVAVSASFTTTASYARSASVAVSSSYALSSSVAFSSSYAYSSSVAVSASYARSASVAVSAITAQTASYVSGIVNASLLYLGTSGYFTSNQVNAAPGGTTPIASIATGSFRGAFFDYTVDDGATNARAGTIQIIIFNNTVQYNETATMDIGDTSDITWSVVISGPDAVVQATTTLFSWDTRYILRSV